MVTEDGKPQAQTTLHLGVFRRLDSASRQVARGSKRPLPRCNFSDSIHWSESLRQLLTAGGMRVFPASGGKRARSYFLQAMRRLRPRVKEYG